MPPARRRPKSKPAPKTRTKARARRSAPPLQLPKLEQRHFDVIGLGLVATAIFFAFVVYLGWDGGQAGDARGRRHEARHRRRALPRARPR